MFAVANHFNSKGGDDPLFGRFQPPVRRTEVQRHQQAAVVAGFVEDLLAADRSANVVVLGDLNDFEFSETLDILEDGGLENLMETLPPWERYSYVFDGNSQTLDQILVSDNADAAAAGVRLRARERRVPRPGVRPRPAGRAPTGDWAALARSARRRPPGRR